MWVEHVLTAQNKMAIWTRDILQELILKYVHVELAFCFLVTNYIYPNKIDRLTYHSIAKVAPVLSASLREAWQHQQ